MRSACALMLMFWLTISGGLAQTAYDFFDQAGTKYRTKDYGAIQDFSLATRLDTKSADSFNNRGLALHSQGKYSQAIQEFTKAIQLNSKDIEAYFNRGNSLIAWGKYSQAIQDLTHAIRLNPNSASSFNSRGVALKFQGKYSQAIQDYSQAIRLDSNNTFAYYNRGVALRSRGDLQEAIQDFTQAVRLKYSYDNVYYYRGLTYETLKNYALAANDFQKAIQSQSNKQDARLAMNRVQRLIKQKQTPKIWIVAVGIESYRYPALLTPLKWSVSNVYQFQNIFLQTNLCLEEQMVILPNSKADKQSILNTIQIHLCNPKKVFPEDMVIFYFVGHGMALRDNFGICPYDYYNPSKLIGEAQIVELLNSSPARHRFCLIESCKSANETQGAALDPELLKRYEASRQQYAPNIVMISSTQVGKDSIEDGEIGGYFSHYLLSGLRGLADGYNSARKDNVVTTRELFDYIKDNVMRHTSDLQQPQINQQAYQSNIPFVPVNKR